jgi:IS605 OrfB family transposase
MNKVTRYQIIKPLDCKWEELGNIFRTLQYETRMVLNKTIQLSWEYYGFASDYKKEHGSYPDAKEIIGYTDIFGYCYDKLKIQCSMLKSNSLSQSIRRATSKFKGELKETIRGDKSIPNYADNQPIDIPSQSIKIVQDEHGYNLSLKLVSLTYAKQSTHKSTDFIIAIKASNNHQRSTLNRILNGQYKLAASQIIYNKDKWFVNINYSFEPKQEFLNPTIVMGIDMGIVYPVYMAFNNDYARYKINGGEIDEFRRRVDHRRRQMLEQRKYCGEGSIGHGIHTRIKPIEVMSDKVANFRDTCNHKYSRYVVDMAVKHKCGVIQMEDLTGISKDEVFLKNWSYYDLQQKIEYKAKEVGINVKYIKPQYTSQRCSKCGHIHKDNRKAQAEFECQVCGFKTNADYNAARNIATPDIDKIIEQQLKGKSVED